MSPQRDIQQQGKIGLLSSWSVSLANIFKKYFIMHTPLIDARHILPPVQEKWRLSALLVWISRIRDIFHQFREILSSIQRNISVILRNISSFSFSILAPVSKKWVPSTLQDIRRMNFVSIRLINAASSGDFSDNETQNLVKTSFLPLHWLMSEAGLVIGVFNNTKPCAADRTKSKSKSYRSIYRNNTVWCRLEAKRVVCQSLVHWNMLFQKNCSNRPFFILDLKIQVQNTNFTHPVYLVSDTFKTDQMLTQN